MKPAKTDISDVSAQLEVQKLQIKILKEAMQEKEREIEEEKRLAAEWKKRAFAKAQEANDQNVAFIKSSPEYKVLSSLSPLLPFHIFDSFFVF
jgi:hypothetical protein